jgi:hypothetical protein
LSTWSRVALSSSVVAIIVPAVTFAKTNDLPSFKFAFISWLCVTALVSPIFANRRVSMDSEKLIVKGEVPSVFGRGSVSIRTGEVIEFLLKRAPDGKGRREVTEKKCFTWGTQIWAVIGEREVVVLTSSPEEDVERIHDALNSHLATLRKKR